MAGAAFSFSGISATRDSVIRIMPAILAAFWRLLLTTLVGSMMPFLNHIAKFIRLGIITGACLASLNGIDDH